MKTGTAIVLTLGLTALSVLGTAIFVPAVAQQHSSLAYQDPALSPQARATDVVARMTIEEKAAQLQNTAPAIVRLGIPGYNWWSEGLHGVARAGEATVFPQAIGMAATWDTASMKQVGDVVGTEFRAKYLSTVKQSGGSEIYRGLTVWSPNVNIFRDPRWGRGQETYGEDPFLTSRMGVAYIEGLQGPNPDRPKVIATVKHLAVHSGPESNRHHEDVHVAPRDMVETYLPAFHAAVTEAKVQSLMCAYNAVDGVPACASYPLLEERLRGSWGFKGFVVSDCGAVADVHGANAHAYVKTPAAAVAATIRAGVDLICDFGDKGTADPGSVVMAVKQGLLSRQELDRAVTRIFEARFRLGLLNPPQERLFPEITSADFDTPAHHQLALRMARESLVLLKNDGLLPLKAEPRRIAVIGPNANSVEALLGNYNGTPTRPVTVLAGLKARFPQAEIIYAEGTGWVAPPQHDAASSGADAALAAANNADLVIFVGGLTANFEGEEMPVSAPGFAGGDRTSLDLPAPQQQLLERLEKTGKPVVYVNMSGSATALNWADKHVPAIIQAWYPGGDGGTAVAELIAGDFSPAGRLPITFYRSVDQLPPFEQYSMNGRTYRYFTGEPLYPFGYGLSYTSFTYAKPVASAPTIKAGSGARISVELSNTGNRASDEVVQVYVSRVGMDVPIRSLVAFQRVHLRAGEKQRIAFDLEAKAFSTVNQSGNRAVESGLARIWIGGGQPQTSFAATGAGATLHLRIAGRRNLRQF